MLADPLARGTTDPLQAKAASPVVQPKGEVGTALPPSSGGSPLPEGVRSGMEASFGTDFSNVKVHTDGAGGAKAFARGEHLHFASGQFDPHSTGGREVIGHELGHVQQQRAGRVPLPQFSNFPVNDDPALEGEADREGAKAARGEKAAIAGSTSGLASSKGAAQGWEWPWKKKAKEQQAVAPAEQQAAAPVDQAAGPAEQPAGPAQQPAEALPQFGPRELLPGEKGRLGKGLVGDAVSKSLVVGAGAGLMAAKPVGEMAGRTSAGGVMGGQGSPAGGMLFGAAGAGAAIAGAIGSRERQKHAKATGDKAGEQIGATGVKESSLAAVQSGVGAATGAVDAANIAKNGAGAVLSNAKTATDLAAQSGNALAIAGAGLGIAGNALAFMQAVYEGGSAIKRWRKLAVAENKIKSARGQTWHERVKNRTKWKTALQGLKAAAAGIGIAAGALLLVSNPVGWALGLAAAATMGVMALGKLFGGIHRKRQQKNAAEELQNKPAAASGAGAGQAESEAKQQVQSQRQEVEQEAPEAQAEDQAQPPDAQAQQATPKKREHVRSRADEAAVLCSTNAKVASEMIGALWVFKSDTQGLLAEVANGDMTRVDEHSDAMTLVYMMGIDEEAALSASGQELIENKISAVNGL